MIVSCISLLILAVQAVYGLAQQPAFNQKPSPRDGLQKVHAIPRQCQGPPPGIDLYKCCPIPRLYPEEVMERCGIEKAEGDSAVLQDPPPRRDDKVPCKEGICLMKAANLLSENNTINYVKLRAFIDNWAQTNSEFTEAILKAKDNCIVEGGPRGPPICEQDRIFFCLNTNILWNCKLRQLSGCDILQEHMDECRRYYTPLKELKEDSS